jgi:LPXTG-motif cell wall-anchored protein
MSIANGYNTVPIATCSNGQSANPTDLTVPYIISISGSVASSNTYEGVTVSTYQVMAPLIDIRWQSSDKTASTSSGASPAGSSGGSPSLKHTGSPGLSTGAQAGIGVGVAVGVLAALLGAFFLWRKRRANSGETEQPHYGDPTQNHELLGNPVYEMQSHDNARELGTKETPWNERHEVHGSQPELPQLPT